MSNKLNVNESVKERYGAASQKVEAKLCCPVEYNTEYLKVIPSEVIERDYGCGDPSQWVKEGDTVLDLGSGTGKICFIASQVVGAKGQVIGVDMTDSMLQVARDAAQVVGEKIGYHNVKFVKGKIEDLALDRDKLDAYLAENPVKGEDDMQRLEDHINMLRNEMPMIPDNSVDVIVSNCVLNLVDTSLKDQLFDEIYRVLKPGGRAVISDIVSDEIPTLEMQNDSELWSGCLSGAYQEVDFLEAFEDVGFYGVELLKRDVEPWQTVKGIEFRSVTVRAWKGKEGECWDHNEAVVYKGPFKEIADDDGHVYPRGERVAVCRKTMKILQSGPYKDHFYTVNPLTEVTDENRVPFPCDVEMMIRDPRETKGEDYNKTVSDSCEPGGSCC